MNTDILADRRILVVEDDYMIAQDVRDELEQAGAIVMGPVPSAARAFRLIGSVGDVDAAILDVNLESEFSFPVAEALQARDIPFLFSTGYNSADVPPEWRHVTITMKPLQLSAVRRLLEASDAS